MPIDLNVDTVAADAETGIYIRELAAGGAIEVNTASAVTVDIDGVLRANFNSTTDDVSQDRMLASLEDLVTATDGPIKLVAEGGTVTVNGGADTAGVSAGGTGDVLLEAQGAASDVVVNADVVSGTGNLTLNALDEVDLNDDVRTGGAGAVDLNASQIGIDISRRGLWELVGTGDRLPDDDDTPISLELPIAFRRRGVECKIVLPASGGFIGADDNLIALVARTRRWFDRIAKGEVTSVREIARQEDIDEGDVSRFLPLAFLAPDIVQAILAGKQPPELTAERLKRLRFLPHEWQEQRQSLGFHSATANHIR